MITPENTVRLCVDCPNREREGISDQDAVTGDLVSRQARYINSRFEFVRDPSETPDVPVQELGVYFVDAEGNKTSAFLPGVVLEDIAQCRKPEVAGRGGFLGRKKIYDCGAQAVKFAVLRRRINSGK